MKVSLFTDGAARGNPEGPGGYGAILQYVDPKGVLHEKEISKGFEKTTNNRMELRGVIAGFRELVRPCEVDVYTDSQYVVNAFEKGWISGWQAKNWRIGTKNEVKNIDLWMELLDIIKPHEVRWHWVKGHAGHPENERCDRLATKAADGKDLAKDD